jgi:hypothetical protein
MTRLNKVRTRTRAADLLVAVEQVPAPLANDNIRIVIVSMLELRGNIALTAKASADLFFSGQAKQKCH